MEQVEITEIKNDESLGCIEKIRSGKSYSDLSYEELSLLKYHINKLLKKKETTE